MQLRDTILAFCFLKGLLASSGCLAQSAAMPDDGTITHCVYQALQEDLPIDPSNLKVDTRDGIVTLDAVAYLGTGNECYMTFHFPLMPQLFMAMRSGDRFPIIDVLQQTAVDSRSLPVGVVSTQPRRVDAGDGDG